jgi:transcriptional regulator with GAF, ATPase, and Fis domain/tetratricopeptide (TPR) repeat protein
MDEVMTQRLGPYRVVSSLEGGETHLWMAEDRQRRRVVLKLHPTGWEEAAGLAELVLVGWRHPGVAACLDGGRLPGDARLYTVTEPVDGRPLAPGATEGLVLPAGFGVTLAARLLSTLADVHARGLLHRDLKPGNVLLEHATLRPVILDFGLACPVDSDAARTSAGTPRAMAPELFRGAPASRASDLWAAGLLLGEALLGRPLFLASEPGEMVVERESFQGLGPDAVRRLGHPALAALIERLLCADPARRPADAVAALAALPDLDPDVARELARERLDARLSGACARHDPHRGAFLAALAGGRVWLDPFPTPQAGLDEALADVVAFARGVPEPGARLAALLPALASSARVRDTGLSGLVRALAELTPVTVAVGVRRAADERTAAARRRVAELLAVDPRVELYDEPPPDADFGVAVLRDAMGARPVLERRLRDAVPATREELHGALDELARSGAVREGEAGLTLDESRLPAAWPLAGAGGLPERLADDERTLLALLALCPLPLTAAQLEAVLDAAVTAPLGRLRARGLVQRVRSEPHALHAPADGRLRRALLAAWPVDGVLRARLVAALVPAADGLDEVSAAAVADVLGGGTPAQPDDEPLTRTIADAADVLRRVGRLERAVGLLERGLLGADQGSSHLRRLHVDRIDTLIRNNAHERALAAVEEARAALPDDQALLVRQARILQLRGRSPDCVALLEHLDADSMPRDDALLGLQVRATARQAVGLLEPALADAREALRRAGIQGDRRTMALLERTASIEEKLGRFDDAARHYEACIAMARRLGHDILIGSPLYNMGRALRARGEKRRGLALQEQGAQRMEAAGDMAGLAVALNGLGAGWLQLGRVDTARRHLSRALALARTLDDDPLAGMVLNNTARALAAEGRLDEAAVAFEQSMALRAGRRDRRGQAAVALTRGQLSLQRGRVVEAETDLALARECLAGLSAPEWEVEADLLQAGVALATGRSADAAQAAGSAAARAEAHAFGAERLRALDLLSRTGAADLEDVDAASLERGPWLADLLFTRAALRSATGRGDAADEDVALALSILGETPDGPVEARGLVLRARGDLARLDELLSLPAPDYGKVGELLSRVTRDIDRARVLVELHDLLPLRSDLDDAARRAASAGEGGEGGDMSGLTALAERLRNLERLAEINKLLNSEHDTQRLLELIVDSAIDLTGAARGFLILFDGRAEEFRAARNIDESTIHHPEFEISHSVARRVVKQGEAMLTANAIDDPRLSSAASISELKLLSILCVPLVSRSRTLGAIYLDHPRVVGRFNEGHLETVTALAEQAAIALENARLSEGLASTNRDLRDSREEIARLNEALQARLVQREAELETVRESLDASRRALALRYDYSNIVTRSPRMHDVLDLLDRVTDTEFPVIIHGESGTGKELIARALHFNGPRRERNFLSLNCAAIAEPLIESELFGSVRGAFTGADRDRKGLFEQAHGGTLFLDEIGDMSLGVQKRLLRVLQEGEFLPVGGREHRRVDVRVLCATHRDLKEMVVDGGFREDLYYRLAVAQVRLPPLRERSEDIALLLPHFLERHDGGVRSLDPEALALLQAHGWPGNVRELENFVMNLLLFDREGTRVTAALVRRVLGDAVAGDAPTLPSSRSGDHGSGASDVPDVADAADAVDAAEAAGLKERMEAYERRLVREALERVGGNKARAARELGVGVRTLYKMLERLGL